jgi:hypothetical protein
VAVTEQKKGVVKTSRPSVCAVTVVEFRAVVTDCLILGFGLSVGEAVVLHHLEDEVAVTVGLGTTVLDDVHRRPLTNRLQLLDRNEAVTGNLRFAAVVLFGRFEARFSLRFADTVGMMETVAVAARDHPASARRTPQPLVHRGFFFGTILGDDVEVHLRPAVRTVACLCLAAVSDSAAHLSNTSPLRGVIQIGSRHTGLPSTETREQRKSL